jgi:sRNA-binding regulator protein Hfq
MGVLKMNEVEIYRVENVHFHMQVRKFDHKGRSYTRFVIENHTPQYTKDGTLLPNDLFDTFEVVLTEDDKDELVENLL